MLEAGAGILPTTSRGLRSGRRERQGKYARSGRVADWGVSRWSGNGRELFFQSDDGMMVASIEASGGTFRSGRPQLLF